MNNLTKIAIILLGLIGVSLILIQKQLLNLI